MTLYIYANFVLYKSPFTSEIKVKFLYIWRVLLGAILNTYGGARRIEQHAMAL